MDIKTANRLQQLRKINGYSQDALAERLGISRQAISKWERAESSPDTDNLIALADLYHMTLDDLLNAENDHVIIDAGSEAAQAEAQAPVKQPALYGALGKKLFKFPFPLLVVILYILLGFGTGLWHPLWLVFLSVPIYYHFAGSCCTKTKKAFMLSLPVPDVIVTIYLILGFCLQLWHPSWILFFVIPVYYWAVAVYVKNQA